MVREADGIEFHPSQFLWLPISRTSLGGVRLLHDNAVRGETHIRTYRGQHRRHPSVYGKADECEPYPTILCENK